MNFKFISTLLSSNLLLMMMVTGQVKREKSNMDKCPDTSSSLLYKRLIAPDSTSKKTGLLTIDQVKEKVYFEIPPKLLNKDILVVNRVVQGPANTKLFAGDENNDEVIRFERGPGNLIWLRKVLFETYAGDSMAPLFRAVIRSQVMPVIASFPIETTNPESSSFLINMTDIIEGDNELFALNPVQKSRYGLTTIEKDKGFVKNLNAFTNNIEISTFKTYKKITVLQDRNSGANLSIPDFVSIELNTSLILLPEILMQQRFSDERVGYLSVHESDFNTNPNGIRTRNYINRWRMEPADSEKYLRGDLVEPKKPIIFYIDPATPKKWVPYLIKGVNAWQSAFEHAGFKNAIIGREAPSKEEDSTWSLEDASHSAIVYKPSDIENAIGNSICDPRTGEILESHIDFHHNILQLIHDWYFVQCSAADPNARKVIFDDSLMGKLIQAVITHEVGHALGLAHNMGASSVVPIDSLRNKEWVEKNGICPSIMDYARFNYIAQPEDQINEDGLIVQLGRYDRWAIEWGYRLFPQYQSPEEELIPLQNWVSERTKDKWLWFGSEHNAGDPRIQKEDLSDDPINAAGYGILNLQRTMKHLKEWTNTPDRNYTDLNHLYSMVQNQVCTYYGHVLANIGGIYETMKLSDQPGSLYTVVPKKIQEAALSFLNLQCFMTPHWLLDTSILNKTGQTFLSVTGDIQTYLMLHLFIAPNSFILENLISRGESNFEDKKTFTVVQFLQSLKRDVWSELYSHHPISLYKRKLQNFYIVYLSLSYNLYSRKHMNNGYTLPISGRLNMWAGEELASFIFAHIKELQKDIKSAIPYMDDLKTKVHLEYLSDELNRTLKKE